MLNVSDQVIGEKLPQSPKSAELLSNLSGVMINTDFVLDYPRAQPPNFINVGGLQIKADPGTIPSDMLSFINSAPEGVLLFTMGFIFNAKVNHILFTKKKTRHVASRRYSSSRNSRISICSLPRENLDRLLWH